MALLKIGGTVHQNERLLHVSFLGLVRRHLQSAGSDHPAPGMEVMDAKNSSLETPQRAKAC